MTNNFMACQSPYPQQIQQMFPQPQGSVYVIGAPEEIGNVPIGSTGLSIALCFNAGIMYIKSFQGGNPMIMAYNFKPFTKKEETISENNETQSVSSFEERLSKIEQSLSQLNDKGGKFNELLT